MAITKHPRFGRLANFKATAQVDAGAWGPRAERSSREGEAARQCRRFRGRGSSAGGGVPPAGRLGGRGMVGRSKTTWKGRAEEPPDRPSAGAIWFQFFSLKTNISLSTIKGVKYFFRVITDEVWRPP